MIQLEEGFELNIQCQN